MVGRKPRRRRVVGNPWQPQRAGVVDQLPEDPPPEWDVSDEGARPVTDAGCDELRDALLASAEYAHRAVAGIGQLHRQFDDALQHAR